MILFRDNMEKASGEVEARNEIKSPENFDSWCIDEARSYWDDIFSKSKDSLETIDVGYYELFSEMLGYSEDDFIFDFEFDDDLLDVMDKFQPENWNGLSEDEKYETLNEYKNILAEKLDLENVPDLIFYDGDPTECGAYIPEINCIRLNTFYLDDPSELLDTIPHEMRHAYQFHRAEVLETKMDLLYAFNFDNYISPECFLEYLDQLVEVEARAFANLFKNPEVA